MFCLRTFWNHLNILPFFQSKLNDFFNIINFFRHPLKRRSWFSNDFFTKWFNICVFQRFFFSLKWFNVIISKLTFMILMRRSCVINSMLVTAYETENKAINKRPIRSNNVLLTLAIKLYFIVIIFTVIYEVTWCATNHAQQTMNYIKHKYFRYEDILKQPMKPNKFWIGSYYFWLFFYLSSISG